MLPWCHWGDPRPLWTFSLSLDTDGGVSMCRLDEAQEVKVRQPGIGPPPYFLLLFPIQRRVPAHCDASSSAGGMFKPSGLLAASRTSRAVSSVIDAAASLPAVEPTSFH